MSQIEVTKLVEYVAIGPNDDDVAVSKLVMYIWATPDESAVDTTNRQGHVYSRLVRNG
jgi:hypothetical protein